jgi:hypothetical protein
MCFALLAMTSTRFFYGENMNPRIVISLAPNEARALIQLAHEQYRHPRQLVALLIHNELEKSGLLDRLPNPIDADQTQASGRVGRNGASE